MKPSTLPLGIDLGSERVRVALARIGAGGRPELVGVATRVRDPDADPADLVRSALAELRCRERRCVFGAGEPHAVVRETRFPPLRRSERDCAARYEIARAIDFPLDDADVRVIAPPRSSSVVIGAIRRERLAMLRALARSVRLRPIAVDHDAYALTRALPGIDAILDVGRDEARLTLAAPVVPRIFRIPIGGATFTQAVADALGLDTATAERRKRTHGIAGCAHAVRARLVDAVIDALVAARADGSGDVATIALVGNGSRIDDLAGAIERAAGVRFIAAPLPADIAPGVPPDVVRAATADWAAAWGLALWSAAA